MTPDEIGRLAEAARRAGVAEIELDGPGTTLRLRITDGPALPPARSSKASSSAVASGAGAGGVTAPGIGRFRHRHPLTGRPASDAGQRVAAGQIVGFLDLGTALRPVTAPRAGVIGAPVLEDGTLVGYGTFLFRLG